MSTARVQVLNVVSKAGDIVRMTVEPSFPAGKKGKPITVFTVIDGDLDALFEAEGIRPISLSDVSKMSPTMLPFMRPVKTATAAKHKSKARENPFSA